MIINKRRSYIRRYDPAVYLRRNTGVIPFSPFDVAGLELWLDASDPSTLFSATSGGSLVAYDGVVARWEDKSGNGYHATQSTENKRPLRKTGVHSLNDTLRFDGSNDGFVLSGGADIFKNIGSKTVFIIEKLNNTSVAFMDVFKASTTTTTGRFSMSYRANGGAIYSGGRRLDADSFQGINSKLTQNTANFIIHECVVDYQGGTIKQFINGDNQGQSLSFQTAGSTSDTASATVQIGGALDANANYFNGEISEIVIYNNVLSDSQRVTVQDYLANKWDIPLARNVTVPYINILTDPTRYLFWKFNQTSYNGTANEVTDSSGTSKHGTAGFSSAGSNTFPTTTTDPAIEGRSIYFTDTQFAQKTGLTSMMGITRATVSIWYYPTTLIASASSQGFTGSNLFESMWPGIFPSWGKKGWRFATYTLNGSSDLWKFHFEIVGSGILQTGHATPMLNRWNHIVASIDMSQAISANKVRIYHDSVLVPNTSSTLSGTALPSTAAGGGTISLGIGRVHGHGTGLIGYSDELLTFREKAMTQAEVEYLYSLNYV